MENLINEEEQAGLSRRSVLRRGAILGGALVWTVPAVQTLSGPAFATGTPCEDIAIIGIALGGCERTNFVETQECCECVATTANFFGSPPPPGARTAAIILCAAGISPFSTGQCTPEGPAQPVTCPS